MTISARVPLMTLVLAVALMAGPAVAQTARPAGLAYQLTEGDNINAFVRAGPVAAHVLLRSGTVPRILVAFPAGNSGVGLWFGQLDRPAQWTLDGAPAPVTLADARGRPLHGVRLTATIAAPRLTLREAVLSNVRFLRDYQAVGKFPAEVRMAATVSDDRIRYARDRVDGAPGYRLDIRLIEGRVEGDTLVAGPAGRIRMEISAGTGDTPLTGLGPDELLNATAADDPAARNALSFLSYREKFLAGSWRFNTYFGRDTLMSLQLLMPALQPSAVEAGLGSVLARLNEAGEVAHEEALSEFAVLERRAAGGSGDSATLDYAMVDDDFMLAPVAATYLLDRSSPDAARAFLASKVASEARPGTSETAGALLVRNLRFALAAARPFNREPVIANLVGLKPGKLNGQWRDSHEGLGGGRYAYDVNAVFVPAALEAAQRLLAAGLLEPYTTAAERAELAESAAIARHWRRHAPRLFRVSTPNAAARTAVGAYASTLGVPAAPALAALGTRPLRYNAIALGADGRPVLIVHSDEGFALLFGDPSPAELDLMIGSIMRPFPAGLMTDIGLVVASAALASSALQADFSPAKYHGAVVWSWQQALLAAGLERQLRRTDLPRATRALLSDAQTRLWKVIRSAREVQSSELWSWAFQDGRYRVVAFGAGKKDVDESNAAQLWSTVYLAVRPPK
jgi:glycogen debranching enzyme